MAANDDWLARTVEPTLEPELPICDPHHHLWDFRPGGAPPRYLLDEFLEDLGSGHNVVSTVFIECGTVFKAGGPEALRPIGETEFVSGIAALSESGHYGPTRVAAGIVGTAYLWLGDAVADGSTGRSRPAAGGSVASGRAPRGTRARTCPTTAPSCGLREPDLRAPGPSERAGRRLSAVTMRARS